MHKVRTGTVRTYAAAMRTRSSVNILSLQTARDKNILKMALTRADIIASIYQRLGFPQKSSSELIEWLIETIKSTLASGEGRPLECLKKNDAKISSRCKVARNQVGMK